LSGSGSLWSSEQRLRALGVNAVLIGEALVLAEDAAVKIGELLRA
jgi:indole-3-glycerol phosphate synthase